MSYLNDTIGCPTCDADVPTPKPRVWDSLADIPEGVTVRERWLGGLWQRRGSETGVQAREMEGHDVWEWRPIDPQEDNYGPFTEVLA